MHRCLASLAMSAIGLSLATAAVADDRVGLTAPASAMSDNGGYETSGVRAVVRAGERIDIAAALSRRLASVPFKPGRYVAKGVEIARFDCARMEADLAAREQAVKTLSLRHDSEAELARFGAAGQLDVDVAASERDQARAEAEAIRVALRDCAISAPFNAYVAIRHVSAYETPQAGQPIYTLIRAGAVDISLIVPATQAQSLKSGRRFTLYMDGGGVAVPARITRLSPDIDPISQTREVFAEPLKPAGLKPGMSGRAVFDAPSEP